MKRAKARMSNKPEVADLRADQPERPEFMVVLGLLPPYTEEDIHKAYFEKAKQAHPDHGGTAGDFHQLHEAFESALHYIEHRTDKRSWIASQVKKYMRQELAVARLRELGAGIEYEVIDWLRNSFGDFAELTEKVTRVSLADSAEGNQVLTCIAENPKVFHGLRRLELSRCQVTDDGAAALDQLTLLEQIDLSGNPVGRKTLETLLELDASYALREVVVTDTNIGWLGRRKLGRVKKLAQ